MKKKYMGHTQYKYYYGINQVNVFKYLALEKKYMKLYSSQKCKRMSLSLMSSFILAYKDIVCSKHIFLRIKHGDERKKED